MIGKRYVQPSSKDSGWDVVQDGHRRATAHAATKEQAVAQASTLVLEEGGGEIRIRDRTGKIADTVLVESLAPARSGG